MKRALLGFLIVALSLSAGPGAATAIGDISRADTAIIGAERAGTEDDGSVVTLADDLDLSDCVSALPDPRCRTREDTDAMQLAVLGVLIAGIGLIGWRIARSVRQRDQANRRP